MLRNNAALFGRASTLRDELARAPEWPPHRTLAQEEEEVNEQEDLFQAAHDQNDGAVQGAEYDDDDQGYDRGDDEVSFKRPELASSSNLSTLVDPDSNHEQYQLYSLHEKAHRESQDYEEQEIQQDLDFSTHGPTPSRAFSQQSVVRTPVQNGHTPEREAEDSLLEVAEKTAAITKELRGVYSNLQELFSPETEAKLNGAMSALNSHKGAGSADRVVNDKRFSTTVPKPLVFETSPVTVQKASSPIAKRKPAPLRPAVMPKPHQNQQQQQQQQRDQRESPTKVHKHDVTLRGLISDADSARRLSQGKKNKDKHPRRSLDSIQAARPSAMPATVSEPLNFESEPAGEKHQERFQRKLDRWKRVERQNLAEAPPLPTYLDLYIPTTSSRSHPQTDYEDEYLEVNGQDEEEEELERERDFEEELEQEQEPERNIFRERAQQDLLDKRAQTAREEELRERRDRRAAEDAEGDYEELADRRRLSKRRRETAFWS
ncbi:hypothetical protein BGZ58_008278 [Dissophora ornata]|nr:hypothetical protein BGZ58_008278 [Dissophora ornata]